MASVTSDHNEQWHLRRLYMTPPASAEMERRLPVIDENELAWGLLFHMLGMRDTSQLHIDRARTEGSSRDLARVLTAAHTNTSVTGLVTLSDGQSLFIRSFLDNPQQQRRIALAALLCNRIPRTRALKASPFVAAGHLIPPATAKLAVFYLLRAHSMFFARPPLDRTFNAARTALNDLFQAYMLTWTMYEHLEVVKQHRSLPLFHEAVKSSLDELETDAKAPLALHSPYFVWALFVVSDYFHGNIYRQLDYSRQAERFYGNACRRVRRLQDECVFPTALTRFVQAPSFIRAMLARSKTQIDIGEYLPALQTQIACLSSCLASAGSTTDDLDVLGQFLAEQRHLPMFERGRLFSACRVVWPLDQPMQRALSAITQSDGDSAALLADLYSRLAFVLYTVRPRQVESTDDLRWLEALCRVHEVVKCAQPEFAAFMQAVVTGDSTSASFEELDRLFVTRVRTIAEGPAREGVTGVSGHSKFYADVLLQTTSNIENILTIPRRNRKILQRHGYIHRRTQGDLASRSIWDGFTRSMSRSESLPTGSQHAKFVVLRRWQSYTPRVPHPNRGSLRGGGYLLIWQGRGIAIDPGFDFVQNLYDEGFSLDDLSAVVVTHAHPDHDDDLSVITTLLREWNEYHLAVGETLASRSLDFMLSPSAYAKFLPWLSASKDVGRVIPLPSYAWPRGQRRPSTHGVTQGVRLDLRELYSMELELVPTWHDDVIGRHVSVGVKFHLFAPGGADAVRVGSIGYTGDSHAYGSVLAQHYGGADGSSGGASLVDSFDDCDVVVAHLGDIRIRELIPAFQLSRSGGSVADWPTPLFDMWRLVMERTPRRQGLLLERAREFLYFATTLELVPDVALEDERFYEGLSLSGVLGKLLTDEHLPLASDLATVCEEALLELGSNVFLDRDLCDDLGGQLQGHFRAAVGMATSIDVERREQDVAVLLSYLSLAGAWPWQYSSHLGIFGLVVLFERLAEVGKSQLLIVGELPEELASYRDKVAQALRALSSMPSVLTGDVGLHVLVTAAKGRAVVTVRCAICDHDNELVCRRKNHHDPRAINEVPIRREGSELLYVCTEHRGGPDVFFSRPEIRVV